MYKFHLHELACRLESVELFCYFVFICYLDSVNIRVSW